MNASTKHTPYQGRQFLFLQLFRNGFDSTPKYSTLFKQLIESNDKPTNYRVDLRQTLQPTSYKTQNCPSQQRSLYKDSLQKESRKELKERTSKRRNQSHFQCYTQHQTCESDALKQARMRIAQQDQKMQEKLNSFSAFKNDLTKKISSPFDYKRPLRFEDDGRSKAKMNQTLNIAGENQKLLDRDRDWDKYLQKSSTREFNQTTDNQTRGWVAEQYGTHKTLDKENSQIMFNQEVTPNQITRFILQKQNNYASLNKTKPENKSYSSGFDLHKELEQYQQTKEKVQFLSLNAEREFFSPRCPTYGNQDFDFRSNEYISNQNENIIELKNVESHRIEEGRIEYYENEIQNLKNQVRELIEERDAFRNELDSLRSNHIQLSHEVQFNIKKNIDQLNSKVQELEVSSIQKSEKRVVDLKNGKLDYQNKKEQKLSEILEIQQPYQATAFSKDSLDPKSPLSPSQQLNPVNTLNSIQCQENDQSSSEPTPITVRQKPEKLRINSGNTCSMINTDNEEEIITQLYSLKSTERYENSDLVTVDLNKESERRTQERVETRDSEEAKLTRESESEQSQAQLLVRLNSYLMLFEQQHQKQMETMKNNFNEQLKVIQSEYQRRDQSLQENFNREMLKELISQKDPKSKILSNNQEILNIAQGKVDHERKKTMQPVGTKTKGENNFDLFSADSLASTLDKECIQYLQKDQNYFMKTDTSLNLSNGGKENKRLAMKKLVGGSQQVQKKVGSRKLSKNENIKKDLTDIKEKFQSGQYERYKVGKEEPKPKPLSKSHQESSALSKSFDYTKPKPQSQPKQPKEDLKTDIMRRINKIEVFLNKNP